jgi:hypothetical protein
MITTQIQNPGKRKQTMDKLNLDFFKAREGKTYQVPIEEGDPYDLVLKDVRPKANPIEGWECFTVYFEGSKHGMLDQQTVTLTQGDDSFLLFLVPVEETKDAFVYESVFNIRLKEEPAG